MSPAWTFVTAGPTLHPASVLMAERVGKLRAHGFVPLTFHDVQVCAADSGATDLDDHVQRSSDRRLWDLLDHGVLVISMQTDGSHLFLLLPNADTRIAVMQHVTAHPGVRLRAHPCKTGPAEVGTYCVDLEAAAGESIHQQRIVISARQAQLDSSAAPSRSGRLRHPRAVERRPVLESVREVAAGTRGRCPPALPCVGSRGATRSTCPPRGRQRCYGTQPGSSLTALSRAPLRRPQIGAI